MHLTYGCLNHPFTCTGSAVSYQRTSSQRVTHQDAVCCSASAVDQFGRSNDASLQSGVPAVLGNLQALYQFSRPHTMLGTFISICSVSLLAMVRFLMVHLHIAYCFLPNVLVQTRVGTAADATHVNMFLHFQHVTSVFHHVCRSGCQKLALCCLSARLNVTH